MSSVKLPVVPPFIRRSVLSPLAAYPDVLLLDIHFDEAHFAPDLFDTLNILLPARLHKAVNKRRAEYLASRYGLQQALATLGIEKFVLHNDEDRAPLWPAGIRGSLSHTHQRICALLTRRRDVLPGIDCEQMMAEEPALEMAQMIVNPAENRLLERLELSFACALTVVFSAKESLYKAIWPELRRFMDFSAAEVVGWDSLNKQITLRLTETFSGEFYAGRAFTVEVELQPDTVLTWVIGLQASSA
ncbi:4'-phosphopantetheinyl transferase [Erwinia sp. JUb26]|uniref:4'-phosphopantetheinyl transferase family protein n=1 Tax=Erwinia sp. JUb26 TaxID=2485126 RepID=UPI000F485916|nr:4'-phosphopantetheinyl transferase superfamily protein [Erwinia sp. JUb26]ROR07786.1 4'-phosphopantetheinyl transferase EntD [Erwinia sp. JUb26]